MIIYPALSEKLYSGALSARHTPRQVMQSALKLIMGLYQVNATGVMPVIFASSLLAVPTTLARSTSNPTIVAVAKSLYPSGALYLPVSQSLILKQNKPLLV